MTMTDGQKDASAPSSGAPTDTVTGTTMFPGVVMLSITKISEDQTLLTRRVVERNCGSDPGENTKAQLEKFAYDLGQRFPDSQPTEEESGLIIHCGIDEVKKRVKAASSSLKDDLNLKEQDVVLWGGPSESSDVLSESSDGSSDTEGDAKDGEPGPDAASDKPIE